MMRDFSKTLRRSVGLSNQFKFDVRTHDESATTLQVYDTVGCSRLLLNLVILLVFYSA